MGHNVQGNRVHCIMRSRLVFASIIQLSCQYTTDVLTLLKRASLQPWPVDLGYIMFNTSDKLSVPGGYTCHGLHFYL